MKLEGREEGSLGCRVWGCACGTRRSSARAASRRPPSHPDARRGVQVTGGELFDRIVAKGSYTEADAAEVMKTLCQALAYMHQKKARPAVLNRGWAVHPAATGTRLLPEAQRRR